MCFLYSKQANTTMPTNSFNLREFKDAMEKWSFITWSFRVKSLREAFKKARASCIVYNKFFLADIIYTQVLSLRFNHWRKCDISLGTSYFSMISTLI